MVEWEAALPDHRRRGGAGRAEWVGGQVTWYVDGQVVQSNVNFPSRGMAIMLTVSGSGLSQTHNAFEIDYMTVYQQST